MNPEAKAQLDRILALSPAELTDNEKSFLSARRSYLTEEQRITFGVSEQTSEDPVVESPEVKEPSHTSDASPARKSRRAS